MEAELVKTFRFEAAHALPKVPHGHKCSRMHGHSYKIDVHVVGPVDPATGWVMDFGVIKRAVDPVIESLDHRMLSDIPGLENSTSENIAKYIWDKVAPNLSGLAAIVVWESDSARCIYRGK